MKFEQLDLLSVGHTIQLTGVIYSSGDQSLLCFLPGEDTDLRKELLEMDIDQWKKFIRQTDLLETEILEETKDKKLTKAVIRKSTRQIEQAISWNVYRRDNFACRYCGRNTVPLTVDHIVLWEKGGPSVEENLVSACRKCNKIRGNIEIWDWLQHPHYKKVSQNLPKLVREMNYGLLDLPKEIELRKHKRSR